MTSTQAIAPSVSESSNCSSSPGRVQRLPLALLYAAIENFPDGLLILSAAGDILHKNRCASRLMQQFNDRCQPVRALPQRVWNICRTLQTRLSADPDGSLILEEKLSDVSERDIRVRVQWLDPATYATPCFIITLEDCQRSAACTARSEAQRYGFTPRETEVWQLRQSHLTYRQIAARLHISIDTVKKHVTNVNAKRSQAVWGDGVMG
ncbi:helix-turn-helix transcriptional regulator [Romeria aff. gracilis LEGE 07310]|uniref:Helix-turn-helix transcriptional regulator n=1 Tax=Vasconcelosia minhoensis LEGE 07310 TaxID=915328 RepID=A0A8J7DMX6_9CYAN|nr:helix-turn-helix transcriptional regulator [Romeria gracilis]MBE9079521.1 helix-turn-helix transcriptional regulator [Romeria aff. gracilis LEGE 07310]